MYWFVDVHLNSTKSVIVFVDVIPCNGRCTSYHHRILIMRKKKTIIFNEISLFLNDHPNATYLYNQMIQYNVSSMRYQRDNIIEIVSMTIMFVYGSFQRESLYNLRLMNLFLNLFCFVSLKNNYIFCTYQLDWYRNRCGCCCLLLLFLSFSYFNEWSVFLLWIKVHPKMLLLL